VIELEVVIAARGVSTDEYLHLLHYDEIDEAVTPWAVIGPDEPPKLKDTFPPPPSGIFTLFVLKNPSEPIIDIYPAWRFGYVIKFAIPRDEIVWSGRGRYYLYNQDAKREEDRVWVYWEDEIGVRRLRRDWVINYDESVDKHLEEEIGFLRPYLNEPELLLDGLSHVLHNMTECGKWGNPESYHEGCLLGAVDWLMGKRLF